MIAIAGHCLTWLSLTVAVEIDAILSDFDTSLCLDTGEQFWGQFNAHIDDLLRVQAVDMTVGIVDAAVESPIATLDAFDQTLTRERFEILIHRRMADVFARLVEAW